MISNVLHVLVLVGDTRSTIGCLIVALVTLISCARFSRRRFQKDSTECAIIAESAGDNFGRQRSVREEMNLVASENKTLRFENEVFHYVDERHDVDPGFAYYNGRDEIDEDDDLVRHEVVEITFDFGSMEDSIERFMSRMHRVVL